MSPDKIILTIVLVITVVISLFAVGSFIGRWLAAAARRLDFPDDDGETM